MQSIILISKSKKGIESYIQKLALKHSIDSLDTLYIVPEGSSLGVKDIKTLQKDIFLTPIKGSKRMVIIQNSELLTVPAQNMLLKTLEEPPDSTFIILVAPTKEVLLPTILSRCSILELDSPNLEHLENGKVRDILENLPQYSSGSRMRLAQDIAKNKEVALAWLEEAIISLRKKLLEEAKTQSNTDVLSVKINMLSSLQKSHATLSTTNVNLRLHLENLFLSL